MVMDVAVKVVTSVAFRMEVTMMGMLIGLDPTLDFGVGAVFLEQLVVAVQLGKHRVTHEGCVTIAIRLERF